MIKVTVKGRRATAVSDEPITTGSVGIPVRFSFDSAWDGLGKVAVFRNPLGEALPDMMIVDGECTVPPEALLLPKEPLLIGIYGTDGENVVIPTIYALAGRVLAGAEPSEIESEGWTPSLAEQVLAAAEEAVETANSVRDDADSGAFIGPQGDPGPPGNYTKPSGGIPTSDLNPEVQASLAASELIASIASNCAVERVTEGTKILGKITGRKLCANVGHYYNAEQDTLSLYAVFSLQGIPGNETRKFYLLFSAAVDEAPVELTPDTAQRTVEVKSDNTNVYAYRPMLTKFTAQKSPLDARFVAIAYDGDGNEIDRVYSAQFRYTVTNGTVTRTRFQTTPEAADHIIDIGLIPIDMSVVEKYGKISKLVNHTLYPLVNTDEGAGYRFIVPDSLYEANPSGLSIATVSGTWDMYRGPNVPKAEEEPETSVTWPATVSTGFENLGTTAELNGTSFTKASTMSFSPEQLDGATFTLGSDTITVTQSMLTDLSALGITGTLIDVPGFGPVVFSCTEAGSVVSEPGLYMATDAISYAPLVTMSYTAQLSATYRMIATGTMEMEDGVTDLPSGVIYLQVEG